MVQADVVPEQAEHLWEGGRARQQVQQRLAETRRRGCAKRIEQIEALGRAGAHPLAEECVQILGAAEQPRDFGRG